MSIINGKCKMENGKYEIKDLTIPKKEQKCR